MQYSLTLNLLANTEVGLNLEQLLLITYFQQKTGITAYQEKTIKENGKLYFWFDPNNVANELPVLVDEIRNDDEKKQLRNRVNKIRRLFSELEAKGAIEMHENNQKLARTYFCLTTISDTYLTTKVVTPQDEPYNKSCNPLTTKVVRSAPEPYNKSCNDNNTINSIIKQEEKTQTADSILSIGKAEQPHTQLKQLEESFECFRVAAKKAGLEGAGGFQTEFDRFKNKNKNWREIIPLLLPALQRNVDKLAQKKAKGEFAPNLPNFATWMNQKRWEQFTEEIEVTPVISAKDYQKQLNERIEKSEITKEQAAQLYQEFLLNTPIPKQYF